MPDFQKFLNPNYYLNLQPEISSSSILVFLTVFSAMVLAGLAVNFLLKSKKNGDFRQKLGYKYYNFLLVMGISGLVIAALRYEMIYFFSARIWMVLWLLAAIGWLLIILKYQFRVAPRAAQQLKQRRQFQKYLPKKK